MSAPPSDLAVKVAKTLAVDLTDHRSKSVTVDMMRKAT
jgi:hypothetical protein